jgi:hypothetical protein
MKMKMNEFGLGHRSSYFMRLRQRLQSEEDVEKRAAIKILASLQGLGFIIATRAEAVGLSSFVPRCRDWIHCEP